MIKKFIQFSMDLYDTESRATPSAEPDHLITNFGGKRQIILWVVDDVLFPEVAYDLGESKAVEFETVKKTMELIEKYGEDSE